MVKGRAAGDGRADKTGIVAQECRTGHEFAGGKTGAGVRACAYGLQCQASFVRDAAC